MKKLIGVLLVSFAMGLSPAVKAMDLTVPVVLVIGLLAGSQMHKPAPEDNCKAKAVKAANGNYYYDSVEHCLKK